MKGGPGIGTTAARRVVRRPELECGPARGSEAVVVARTTATSEMSRACGERPVPVIRDANLPLRPATENIAMKSKAARMERRRTARSEADPIASPHLEEELNAIRQQRPQLKKSNTGPQENFENCLEVGKASE
jgi:hypothetical protein